MFCASKRRDDFPPCLRLVDVAGRSLADGVSGEIAEDLAKMSSLITRTLLSVVIVSGDECIPARAVVSDDMDPALPRRRESTESCTVGEVVSILLLVLVEFLAEAIFTNCS